MSSAAPARPLAENPAARQIGSLSCEPITLPRPVIVITSASTVPRARGTISDASGNIATMPISCRKK